MKDAVVAGQHYDQDNCQELGCTDVEQPDNEIMYGYGVTHVMSVSVVVLPHVVSRTPSLGLLLLLLVLVIIMLGCQHRVRGGHQTNAANVSVGAWHVTADTAHSALW